MQKHAETYKKNAKHDSRKKAEANVHLRNNRARTRKIANQLSERLLGMGFTVHRCDAKTSASVYLCVDYGLSNSIRISDHPGKRHLKYRYNILLGMEEKLWVREEGCDRYFYPPDAVDTVVVDISIRLGELIRAMGTAGYMAEKERLKREKEGSAGFWQYAVEVLEDGDEG